MGKQDDAMTESTKTILVLLFLLLGLVFLLLFLYKKLNREAQGEYTIRRMVYKEGGVRDRVRGAAVALGSRLGVQLWPGRVPDEDGEEMREFQDMEGGSSSSSIGSLTERKKGEEEEEEEGEEEARDTTDDNSKSLSLEEEEEEERNKETDPPKSEEKEAKEEENGGGAGPEQVRAEAGLLIDLKQFSGSAIWSEEDSCAGACDDVTAL